MSATPLRKRASAVADDYAHSFYHSPTSDPQELRAGLMALVVIGMQIGATLATTSATARADLLAGLDAESLLATNEAARFILSGERPQESRA